MIDLSVHKFPPEGEFGHMKDDPYTAHRREFMLYPKEKMDIPYFDARFLEPEFGNYHLHSMEIGYFGTKAKYVDRCLNLLYEMITTTPEISSSLPAL
jgi:hypothetical protein